MSGGSFGMNQATAMIQRLDDVIWGPWMLYLFLGTGIFLMLRMHFLPIRRLGFALRCAFQKEERTEEDGISPFSSLMTELAATIGTGNIVGVAMAMTLGGPGALVWMVISSLIGLSTKFAESMLAVKYRRKNQNGEYCGGPMVTLERAFPVRKAGVVLAVIYAVSAVLASFGMGNMTQSNSIASAMETTFGIPVVISGFILSGLTLIAVYRGIHSISGITVFLVPAMALLYLGGCMVIIFSHPQRLLQGCEMILRMAFSSEAIAGGMGGSLVASGAQALRYGVSRGVFSNEAGLGAGGISAAAARTDDPVRQGYISMTGVFLDTVVICTITGLMLASSGVLGMCDREGRLLNGTDLTIAAFAGTFGEWGAVLVSIAILLFAFATILGWAFQGEKAWEYLVKDPKKCKGYRVSYSLISFLGAVCSLHTVWNLADICNAVMAIPNLICVVMLSGETAGAIREYEKKRKF